MIDSREGVAQTITINIKRWLGDWVRFERYNDGLRYPIDEPYQKKGSTARFVLPTGKKKTEMFSYESTNEEILAAIQKKYSNFKFTLNP
jgi:hypothetical protein